MDVILSKNAVPVRLPDERWAHIIEEHGELADRRQQVLDTLAEPERILEGGVGELLAVREVEVGKAMVVIYREFVEAEPRDGFIITAFLTRRIASLNRRKQLWP
jgi:hypothetical protein